ncbi:YrhK family protein [Psychrobacter piscatorii]|uniref:YrhK family protein n=1 Tax=Psychrobacter piscatorii TaxID=554343 RepID=UPI000A898E53
MIGSFFFLKESLTTDGTCLFILGSAQLLIKPLIKLISLIHVGRVYNRSNQR